MNRPEKIEVNSDIQYNLQLPSQQPGAFSKALPFCELKFDQLFLLFNGESISLKIAYDVDVDELKKQLIMKYWELVDKLFLFNYRLENNLVTESQINQFVSSFEKEINEPKYIGDYQKLIDEFDQLKSKVPSRVAEFKEKRNEEIQKSIKFRNDLIKAARDIAAEDFEFDPRDFSKLTRINEAKKSLDTIFNYWNIQQRMKVQPPKQVREDMWNQLKVARRILEKKAKAYFNALEHHRKEVDAKKEELIKKSQELSSNEDLAFAANEQKHLAFLWKKLGKGSRDRDEALNKEFRKLQDEFFVKYNANKPKTATKKDTESKSEKNANGETTPDNNASESKTEQKSKNNNGNNNNGKGNTAISENSEPENDSEFADRINLKIAKLQEKIKETKNPKRIQKLEAELKSLQAFL